MDEPIDDAGNMWDRVGDSMEKRVLQPWASMALLSARAALGDKDGQMLLQLKRTEEALKDARIDAPRLQKDLQMVASEKAEAEEELSSYQGLLEAQERDHREAEAWISSCLVSDLLQRVGDLHSSGQQGGSRATVSSVQQKYMQVETELDHLRSQIAEEEATVERLQTQAGRSSMTMRQAEVSLEQQRAELEEELAVSRRGALILRQRLQEEKLRCQTLDEQSRQRSSGLRQKIDALRRQKESLQMQLRRTAADLEQCQACTDVRWAKTFSNQLSAKDDRNRKVHRNIAEASQAAALAEAEADRSNKVLRDLNSAWLWEQQQFEIRSQRRQQLQSDLQEQQALLGEVRYRATLQDALVLHDSDQCLRSEVDALRRQIANESHWLQSELSSLRMAEQQSSCVGSSPLHGKPPPRLMKEESDAPSTFSFGDRRG